MDCGQGFYFYPFVLTYNTNKSVNKSTGIDMLLFPNPTKSDFTVVIKSDNNTDEIKGQIIIYDIYGRIIKETNNISTINKYSFADKLANFF